MYNCRLVQPGTIDKLKNAKDGEFIGVEPNEFQGIRELHLFEPEVNKMAAKDRKDRPRTIRDEDAA